MGNNTHHHHDLSHSPGSLSGMSATLAHRGAAQLARQCTCACLAGPAAVAGAVRQASTSTAVATTTNTATPPKKSLWQRIAARADTVAVNARPPVGRLRAAMLEDNIKKGEGSIFERTGQNLTVQNDTASKRLQTIYKGRYTEHKTSTGNIKYSLRKLNDIARLISGMPIDHAILQMQISDKRVAQSKIKSMLALARDHAIAKGLRREELVVKEAWVNKGVYLKRLDIKGRGRHGIIMKPESRMHVVLAPGPSRAELKQQEFEKQVQTKLRTGAGAARADRPIINVGNLKGQGVVYAW